MFMFACECVINVNVIDLHIGTHHFSLLPQKVLFRICGSQASDLESSLFHSKHVKTEYILRAHCCKIAPLVITIE